jgi:hypothetical protein
LHQDTGLAPYLASDEATVGVAPLAHAGFATGAGATAEAVRQAVVGLGERPSLVLVFPDGSLDPEHSLAEALAAAPGGRVAGMTASGAISVDGPLERGCASLAFGSSVRAAVGVAEDVSTDPRAAGREAARAALRPLDHERSGHVLLIVMVDAASGDQSDIVAGIYEAAGPRVPLVGGGAGGDNPAQLGEGAAGEDRAVCVALLSPSPVGVGLAHACSKAAPPAIVTRARDRIVQQIDGLPAEEVYLERLGIRSALSDAEFERAAAVHPLAQPELRGDWRLRHVLGRTPGGGLRCATHIPENAAVEFTRQTPDAIARSTWDAVNDSLAPLGGGPARAALVFDCAGRRSALGGPGDELDAEVHALVGSFGEARPQLAGLYTRGEIGRVRGAKGDRNHAVVVASFG